MEAFCQDLARTTTIFDPIYDPHSLELRELVKRQVVLYYPTETLLKAFHSALLAQRAIQAPLQQMTNALASPLKLQSIIRKHWIALADELKIVHPAKRFDLVLYHANCPDGLASAWCFWRHNQALQMIPVAYGQAAPEVQGRRVVLLDYSYPRDVLLQLAKEAELLEVYDHHLSAQRALEGLEYCYFDMTRSGCEMAWDYTQGSDSQRPWFLQAIADRDLWKSIADSEAICKAIYHSGSLTLEGFDQLFNYSQAHKETFLKEGQRIVSQEQLMIARATEASGLYRFAGYTVRVGSCNPVIRSDLGHSLCKVGDCDFSAVWQYNLQTDEWYISLRGMGKVDLAQVASLMGGGGHRNASGFSIYGGRGESIRTYFQPQ